MKLLVFIFSFLPAVTYSQWIKTNGPNGGNYQTVTCMTVNGSNLYAGNYVGVFISTNSGELWTNTGLIYVSSLVVKDSNLFAATTHGLFLSSNSGGSWLVVLSRYNVSLLVLKGTDIFAVVSDSVFVSSDNGTTWNAVGLVPGIITAFAVIGTNLFAATQGNGVFLSTNSGTSWTAVNTGLISNVVFSLVVVGTNLFAGTGIGVCRSTNNGTSWRVANAGIPFPLIDRPTYVEQFAVSDTNIFAATHSDGVFLSTNYGTSWTSINSGLTNTLMRALVTSGKTLYAGEFMTGVWRRPLSEILSVTQSTNKIPTISQLEQNYPNPFNPATTIFFNLTKSSFVTLKIFDMLGKEIATLLSENLSPGNYSRRWDASQSASGVYYYRLQTDGYSETKKMILLK